MKKSTTSPDNLLIEDSLQRIVKKNIENKAHVASSLSLYIRRFHLGKMFCLYEAFKKVVDLPGSVVELGVFKGESLLLFGKLMEIFNNNDRSCEVLGFDTFSGFPSINLDKDGVEDPNNDKRIGGWNSSDYYSDLLELIEVFDHDRFVGTKPRIRLIKGDIGQTLPSYVRDNPGLRIRLLNLDADLYDPTLAGLTHLYDRVVPGGIVLLDEYGFNEFPGESKAVEDFFAGKKMPVIRKFPMNGNPGGYFIKE